VRPSSKPGVGRTTEEEEALLYVLWDDDEDELEDEDLDHEDHEAEEILKAKEKTRFHMLFGKKRGSAGGGEASTSNGAGGSVPHTPRQPRRQRERRRSKNAGGPGAGSCEELGQLHGGPPRCAEGQVESQEQS